jgi:hypothetical protein
VNLSQNRRSGRRTSARATEPRPCRPPAPAPAPAPAGHPYHTSMQKSRQQDSAKRGTQHEHVCSELLSETSPWILPLAAWPSPAAAARWAGQTLPSDPGRSSDNQRCSPRSQGRQHRRGLHTLDIEALALEKHLMARRRGERRIHTTPMDRSERQDDLCIRYVLVGRSQPIQTSDQHTPDGPRGARGEGYLLAHDARPVEAQKEAARRCRARQTGQASRPATPAIDRGTYTGAWSGHGMDHDQNWLRFPYDSTYFGDPIISPRTRSPCSTHNPQGWAHAA